MMTKYKYLLLMMVVICFAMTSCSDSDEIGDPIEIKPDYVLPQEGASASANQRIQELYNKYGSYFLYRFDAKDAFWVQYTGNASQRGSNFITEGNPANVDAMLDFLTENWLNYFPDDFLKKGGIPYRVFLANEYYNYIDWGGGNGYRSDYTHQILGNAIIIAGLDNVANLDAAGKKAKKLDLIKVLWNYYVAQGLVTIPDEFYNITDYITVPSSAGYYSWTTAEIEAFRARGFLPVYSTKQDSWYYGSYYWNESAAKTQDVANYMDFIFNATDAELEQYFVYPMIKKKFELLTNHFKNTYGLDLRAIAN